MALKFWRSDNLHYRRFSFVAPRPTAGWPGWALLLVGSVTLALAATNWISLRDQLRWAQVRLDERQALAPPERAARPVVELTPEQELLKREQAQILATLKLNWQSLFGALEQAQTADVALLSIAPDARRGTVLLNGEGRNMAAVIDYQRRLANQLQDVVLVTHEEQEQNPFKPVRFSATARWTAGGER